MPATQTAMFEKRATALGAYWTSPLSKAAVRHVLRGHATTRFKSAADTRAWWESHAELKARLGRLDPDSFQKAASLGGDQEGGFEQAFSSLAYAYLKDKSPRLLDFIVGFQLVDRNEDNTKAIGIFGFKVGAQWLYAPCFFLNGDLKGHELLYIKNQDAFVPMKENWVNHLISRRPHVLGEGSDQNTFQLGGMMPSLSKLNRPPGGTKYGSDAVLIDEWARPALPPFFALGTKKAAAFYPGRTGTLNFAAVVGSPARAALAPYAQRFDMRSFLGDFPLLKSAFETAYTRYPLIKAGFDKFYGPTFFRDMAAEARSTVDSLVTRTKAAADRRRPAPVRKKASDSLIPEHPARDKNHGLEVIALDLKVDEDAPAGIQINKPELDEEEREKLLRDTVLIKDKRENTSIAYNTQVQMELMNPGESGLYTILEKPGKFSEMLVIAHPFGGRGKEPLILVVRKSKTGAAWLLSHLTNIWAKSEANKKEDFKKWVESMGRPDSLEKGSTYYCIHPNGSGSCPFKVKEDYGDGVYKVEWHRHYRKPQGDRPRVDPGSDGAVKEGLLYIRTDRKGTSLKPIAGDMHVTADYAIVKVSARKKPDPDEEPDNWDIVEAIAKSNAVPMKADSETEAGGNEETKKNPASSEEEPIQPGTMMDLHYLVGEKTASLKVHDTGTDVVIKTDRWRQQLTKKAAFVSLVRDHGLREAQARDIVKQAAALAHRNVAAQYRIKYAQGFGMGPGPDAPAFPEPETGVEQNGYSSVNAQYPQEEFLPVEGMQSESTDPSTYDPFYQPDQNAMQVAQQAASSGQKEVFDTAMIGGMLKSVRQDSLVDRYLGDLMKALDKLGRILFMFYWHNEEFEDRYGKQDLPELEDSLRNAFEVMGDVVLFLKEKSVGGGANLNASGVGPADAGEPNIQEAARN